MAGIIVVSCLFLGSLPVSNGFIPTTSHCRSQTISSKLDAVPKQHQISLIYNKDQLRLRSLWMAQELLTTFAQDASLAAVCITLDTDSQESLRCECVDEETATNMLLKGDFPEPKELKQRIRDVISPDKDLGHSDRPQKVQQEPQVLDLTQEPSPQPSPWKLNVREPYLSICYCTGCRWLLRAAYLGMELTADQPDLSFCLMPSRDKGGEFRVQYNEELWWDRRKAKSFPTLEYLQEQLDAKSNSFDEIDDDESEDARRYFGVM